MGVREWNKFQVFRFVGLLHSGTFIRGVGFDRLGCEVGNCSWNFSKLCLFLISDCIFLGEATGLFVNLYVLGSLRTRQGKESIVKRDIVCSLCVGFFSFSFNLLVSIIYVGMPIGPFNCYDLC